ncbi:MAG: 3D domain-containing protein, partial [Gemmatimonadaceae bacterium]
LLAALAALHFSRSGAASERPGALPDDVAERSARPSLALPALTHSPLFVHGARHLPPVIVLVRRGNLADSTVVTPAQDGAPVRVQLTAYCLRGLTRSGHPVADGVIAADPRLFPLGREIDVRVGTRHIGRFHVRDTGKAIKGAILDIWKESCGEAILFGRRRGSATLVAQSAP